MNTIITLATGKRIIIVITTIATVTIKDTATTGSVTAVESHIMDWKKEYDRHIVQLGARYATIAE